MRAVVTSSAPSMPGTFSDPAYFTCESTNALMPASAAGLAMKSATSSVKKSLAAMNRSTVFTPMWSASTKYAPVQPSDFVAASASARTLSGSLWTMLCSRLDLFQTGATSTPSRCAVTNAASCARPWWAKRSPMPMEYLGRLNVIEMPLSSEHVQGGSALEAVYLYRRPAEQPRAFAIAQRLRPLPHRLGPTLVLHRRETHRPIR